jgi:hypothetical protein
MNGNGSASLPVARRWRRPVSTLGILASLCGFSGTAPVRAAEDQPVKPAPRHEVAAAVPVVASPRAAVLSAKLKTIRIPAIEFADTSLEEAIDFIRLEVGTLEAAETDYLRRGLNLVSMPPAHAPAAPGAESGGPRIKELRLHDVPLGEALHAICEATGMRYRVDDWAVTLLPAAQPEKPRDQPEVEATPEAAAMMAKLKEIIIPVIEFDDTSVVEALDFFRLRQPGVREDGSPAEKKLEFTLRDPAGDAYDEAAEGRGPGALRIKELRLRNVPEIEAVRYVCELTGLRCQVNAKGVVLVSGGKR